jgi:prepilin-type N-terminal cleavage/methylation domain-containing protein
MKIKNQIKTLLNNQSGLTLIELLLVVVILSTVAFMTLSVVENGTDQVRYEDSGNRLGVIRTSIVGDTSPAFTGQRLLSGYVANNGLLPLNIAGLTTQPVDYDNFASLFPIFDQDPDNGTGINNAANSTALIGNANRLFKGYRAGGYLAIPPGSAVFQDGWGNNWTEAATATTFPSTTPGKNNLINGADIDYERDITDTIIAEEWQVDTTGWQVNVENLRAAVVLAGAGCFRVSLLVYVNNANNPADDLNWRRLTSDCVIGNDLQLGNNAITFPIADAVQTSMSIPQGEHLLVLVQDTDNTTRHNGTSEIHTFDVDAIVAGIQLGTAHVNFYAGAARPSAKLVIR